MKVKEQNLFDINVCIKNYNASAEQLKEQRSNMNSFKGMWIPWDLDTNYEKSF